MQKVVTIAAVVALVAAGTASAQFFGGESGGLDGYGGDEHKEYYAYPKYKFEYGVMDHKTGDHKTHWEIRDGDVVKGEYSLHEPDGSKRIVEYKSDKHSGFEAHVKREHPHLYGGGGDGGDAFGYGG